MARLSLFISAAPVNMNFVDRIEAELAARNLSLYADRDLLPTRGGKAENWPTVRRQIDQSDAFLLVVSPQGMQNADVDLEWKHAVSARKLIIPLKLRPVNLPDPLGSLQWFDFEEGRFEVDLKHLLFSLAFVTPGSPATLDPATGTPRMPEPPESLQALFIAATSAKARGTPEDTERAAAIYAHILERDPSYQGGVVRTQIDQLTPMLETQRVQALERQADHARASGEWGREIAALLAWGKSQGDRMVEARLASARLNQQYVGLYTQAVSLEPTDPGAARETLRMLYQAAPNYGDPSGVAARLAVSNRPAPPPVVQSSQPKTVPAPAPVSKPPAPVPAQPVRGAFTGAPAPTAPPAPKRGMSSAWWYLVGAFIGLTIGWSAGSEAAAVIDDCIQFDAFFGVFFNACETSFAVIGGLVGMVVGAAIVFVIAQRRR